MRAHQTLDRLKCTSVSIHQLFTTIISRFNAAQNVLLTATSAARYSNADEQNCKGKCTDKPPLLFLARLILPAEARDSFSR